MVDGLAGAESFGDAVVFVFIAAWIQLITLMLSAQMPNQLRLNFPTLHHALLCKNSPQNNGRRMLLQKRIAKPKNDSPKTTSLTVEGLLQVQAYEPTEDRGSKAENRKVGLDG